jgi:hypothetical protein
MKGFHSAGALIALMLAACADQGPTAPRGPANDLVGISGVQASMTDADDDLLMIFMGGGIETFTGGGIEGVRAAAEPGSLDPLSASLAHARGFASIDVPGAVATRAFGINAVGQIVGSYTNVAGATYGYLWAKGNVTSIQFPGAIATEAWGINLQGDIVGRYRKASDPRTYGFLMSGGVFTDISVSGHLNTLPIKISPAREIVGCFHDTNFLVDMRGYMQHGHGLEAFELLPSTMHNGVTPGARVIAGISFESATLVHGYVLEAGEYKQFDYPGATFTQAWDVSPTGTVVGYFNPVTSHGFARDLGGGLTQIDVPGAQWTRAFGIDPQGELVGSYADATNTVHGFLWRRGGKKN